MVAAADVHPEAVSHGMCGNCAEAMERKLQEVNSEQGV